MGVANLMTLKIPEGGIHILGDRPLLRKLKIGLPWRQPEPQVAHAISVSKAGVAGEANEPNSNPL